MTGLESSKVSLGRAYPLIIGAIEKLDNYRNEMEQLTSSEDEVVQI
jgi:hypothetical protein